MHRRDKKLKKSFFPKCFTLCYKLCGWVVQSSFFQNVCYLEVSAIGSTGLFVDLDQENASVWSPSPETNLEKRGPHPGRQQHDTTTTNLRRPSAALEDHPAPPRTRTRAYGDPISHFGAPLVLIILQRIGHQPGATKSDHLERPGGDRGRLELYDLKITRFLHRTIKNYKVSKKSRVALQPPASPPPA